jgi:hypothetical protein
VWSASTRAAISRHWAASAPTVALAWTQDVVVDQADRCAQLEDLKTDFPGVADTIEIRRGEANEEIQRTGIGSRYSPSAPTVWQR